MIGLGKRISYAARCFFSVLSRGEVPEDIAPEVIKTPPREEAVPEAEEQKATPSRAEQAEAHAVEDSTDRAVQMLTLLQRDGRLIDFFTEDIAPYDDAQVGAAVRELHANCRKVLEQYLSLEPIL